MKRTLVAAWVVGICMMGWGVEAMAQEVTTLIRVNTDDTAAYLAWAEESMPIVMAAAGADPLVGGVCVPMFGAEQEGDIYVWTTTPSFAAALSVDLDAPAAAREIAKVAPIRTVVSRDLSVTIKPSGAAGLAAGSTFSLLLLRVDTDQVDLYITLLTELEEAAHQNGFPDVNFEAKNITTGEFQGRIEVPITAPTAERLGAYMDANQSESWATEVMRQFPGIRSIVQQMVHSCHVYAVQQ